MDVGGILHITWGIKSDKALVIGVHIQKEVGSIIVKFGEIPKVSEKRIIVSDF